MSGTSLEEVVVPGDGNKQFPEALEMLKTSSRSNLELPQKLPHSTNGGRQYTSRSRFYKRCRPDRTVDNSTREGNRTTRHTWFSAAMIQKWADLFGTVARQGRG